MITLLDNGGKEISHAAKFTTDLTIPENSYNLQRLIKLLVDRIYEGDAFHQRENNPHKNFINNKNNAILEEDEET